MGGLDAKLDALAKQMKVLANGRRPRQLQRIGTAKQLVSLGESSADMRTMQRAELGEHGASNGTSILRRAAERDEMRDATRDTQSFTGSSPFEA